MRFLLPIHLLGLAWLWRDCPSRKCVTSRFLWATCNQSWHKLLRMAAIKVFSFYCVTWRNNMSCTLNNEHFGILECMLISDSSTCCKKKLWNIFFRVYSRVLSPSRSCQALKSSKSLENISAWIFQICVICLRKSFSLLQLSYVSSRWEILKKCN